MRSLADPPVPERCGLFSSAFGTCLETPLRSSRKSLGSSTLPMYAARQAGVMDVIRLYATWLLSKRIANLPTTNSKKEEEGEKEGLDEKELQPHQ